MVAQGVVNGYPDGTSYREASFFAKEQKDNAQLPVFQVNGMIGKAVKVGDFYTKVNDVKAIDAVKVINGVASDI